VRLLRHGRQWARALGLRTLLSRSRRGPRDRAPSSITFPSSGTSWWTWSRSSGRCSRARRCSCRAGPPRTTRGPPGGGPLARAPRRDGASSASAAACCVSPAPWSPTILAFPGRRAQPSLHAAAGQPDGAHAERGEALSPRSPHALPHQANCTPSCPMQLSAPIHPVLRRRALLQLVASAPAKRRRGALPASGSVMLAFYLDFTCRLLPGWVGGDMSVCGSSFRILWSSRRAAMAGRPDQALYESMPAKLDRARKRFGRALTLSEKIPGRSRADDFDKQEWSRGKPSSSLRVDRVSLQDARPDGASSSSCRREEAGRRAEHRALRSPDPRAERRLGDTKRAITENNEGLRFPPLRLAQVRASASGSPARASSTRSCSRTTPSRAGSDRADPYPNSGGPRHGRHRGGGGADCGEAWRGWRGSAGSEPHRGDSRKLRGGPRPRT